jgi:hypothetical protein
MVNIYPVYTLSQHNGFQFWKGHVIPREWFREPDVPHVVMVRTVSFGPLGIA